eukprot:1143826-Pelagomonas_calceolata.AAC.1
MEAVNIRLMSLTHIIHFIIEFTYLVGLLVPGHTISTTVHQTKAKYRANCKEKKGLEEEGETELTHGTPHFDGILTV